LIYSTDIFEESILPCTLSILYKVELYWQEIKEQIKGVHLNKEKTTQRTRQKSHTGKSTAVFTWLISSLI